MNKEEIRKEYRKKRKSIPNKEEKALLIAKNVLSLASFLHAEKIGIYCSTEEEVSTYPIMEKAWHLGKKIYVPKVLGDGRMEFVLLKSFEDLEEKGAFGIYEPKDNEFIDGKELDVLIVPGVVFDEKGYRIGYGGGYYDRYLERYPELDTIGLAFQAQMYPSDLPHGGKDLPVGEVITEKCYK